MKRIFILFALVLICALTLTQSLNLPEPNIKCNSDCDMQEYKQICAADDAGTTKTFRNLCVMKSENCLHQKTFQKIQEGACP